MFIRIAAVAALAAALTACTPTPAAAPAPAPARPAPLAAIPPPPPAAPTVTVTSVVDGDTIHVQDSTGARSTIRIIGIDTPETKKPRTPVQCGGPEASKFAHDLLAGRKVQLVPDHTQDDRDRYGRALRYVYIPDGNYSVAVVRAGWARVYVYGHRKPAEYDDLEREQREAVAARRGIWGICPNPEPGD